MSRVYWHSPSRDVELHGSERAHLAHVARGPADAAWDLDTPRTLDRAAEILALVPEVPDDEYGRNYLHTFLREAQVEDDRNKVAYAAWKPGTPMAFNTSHGHQRRLVDSLRTKLHVDGVTLVVAGVELHSGNVDLNTALAAGSDAVCLAAKIHGWCESHCWVEGVDRAWLADVIDTGLAAGIYRRGFWYVDRPCDGKPADQPDRKWSTQGWEGVTAFLRERDDEPVVLSHSSGDGFPNREAAGMRAWPDGVPETWAAYDAMPADQRTAMDEANARLDEEWEAMPSIAQWARAWDGLREAKPWARISEETLRTVTFAQRVTVYDLFAPDRDQRVRAAAGLDSELESETTA